jgi:hypothetical protein
LTKVGAGPLVAPERQEDVPVDLRELAAAFEALQAELLDRVEPGDRALVAAARAERPKASRTYGFEDLGTAAVERLRALAALPEPRRSLSSRALIAGLCAGRAERFGEDLTARVRERSVDSYARLLAFLNAEPEGGYAFPDDYFLKDYRFATGMTVPCGAQVVDLAERPGVKTMAALLPRAPGLAWDAATRPWFKPHTESRYLDEFNEEGWNRCYGEMADLMDVLPDVAGMVATSWFYDPALTEISPRLAYLRQVPMAAGAVSVRHGTTQFDIDSATKTSPSRRALYQEGKYIPTCWSIVWPRAAMLAWRDRYRAEAPVSAAASAAA